jgi:hypothetical protein
MPLFLLVVAQAISAGPPRTIDLTVRQPCAPQRIEPDEVVVCAKRGESNPYRIDQWPRAELQLPKAVVGLAEGVSAAAETDRADVGGFPANRVMLRLKLKF